MFIFHSVIIGDFINLYYDLIISKILFPIYSVDG